jgi:hypothetical protein
MAIEFIEKGELVVVELSARLKAHAENINAFKQSLTQMVAKADNTLDQIVGEQALLLGVCEELAAMVESEKYKRAAANN